MERSGEETKKGSRELIQPGCEVIVPVRKRATGLCRTLCP